jgi:hypothetical protein
MDAVIAQLGGRFSASQIRAQLVRDFPGRYVPSERTIQKAVRALGPMPSGKELWSMVDADPDEAAAVLPVIRELIHNSNGMVGLHFSKATGRWIAKLRQAVPELPAGEALMLAQRYRLAEAGGYPTPNLDTGLALMPWSSEGNRVHADGWLPRTWRTLDERKARNG